MKPFKGMKLGAAEIRSAPEKKTLILTRKAKKPYQMKVKGSKTA